ncbi:MAG: CoA-transferase [Acidimicrobiales bacterium]|jgi:crotonobetainyl-CoA:carnitine CoA-transferase CaiB-like acyl-CoA transferase|nr:CoA-transferase [Acidimicrobiales bacterium]
MREARPLEAARVLDLSGPIGAYCSKLLADLGADVIKVELPSGDALRHQPPFRDDRAGPESALMFAYFHHNKRGITLDWERADAQALLSELASDADVVIASPKGDQRRLTGFVDDPPSLSWVPATVLTCFITPFGVTGPYRDWRATPFTSFAMSGCMYPVGRPEGPPVAMPGQQLYDEAGIWAAFLIQAVLRGPSSARAQVIDLAAHEVGFFRQLGQEQYSERCRIKTRESNFAAPPSGIWNCTDGLLDIAVHTPEHWDVFVDLVGRPAMLVDPIYRDRKMRIEMFDVLGDVVTDLLATRSAREFVRAGQSAGLPCAVMHTICEVIQDEQLRARQFFVETSRQGTGSFDIAGAPFQSAPTLISYRRAAPQLGESNEEIYVDELSHSPDELAKWRHDGLV